MKKFGSILLFILLLLISTSCGSTSPKITEEQAKSIVIEHHTDSIGEVEIISITHKNNKYRIEWENKENCENGIDMINDENGDIEMVEASIC
ncbi:hypothetical protein [Mesobacillus maritimus]|uniref:hypothetical protein n=1 Tax=Mesobacillus maritimus TaxID=1643336 RepID=UPI003850A992